MSEMVTLVLPEEVQREGGKVLLFNHPRTGRKCQFLVKNDNTKVWELTNVDGMGPYTKSSSNEARSLIFEDGHISSAATIVSCTPYNALYFILGTLYANRSRYMTLDDLHDIMEQQMTANGCNSFPLQLLNQIALDVCCDIHQEGSESFYKLNETKLLKHLDQLGERIKKSLPAGIRKMNVFNGIMPVDINAEPPAEIVQAADQKLVLGLITSNLSPELRDFYYSSKTFYNLDKYLADLKAERDKARHAQEALQSLNNGANGSGKRAAKAASTGTNKRAKKQQPPASKSKSITSFFKKA